MTLRGWYLWPTRYFGINFFKVFSYYLAYKLVWLSGKLKMLLLYIINFLIFKIFSRDISNGGTCTFDPETNLPDENCLFYPSATNNENIRSSFMSAPFLKALDNFCNSSELHHHDIYKPNKHNFMVPIIYFFDGRSPSRHKQSFFI